jgi:DNA-binding response OmpR family regulator
MNEPDNLPVVLVVDDIPDIRELIETGVDKYRPGFKVVFTETAEDALKLIETQTVSAVVLDVNLMGDSGASLAADLHEKYPHINKAFLTAYDRSMTHKHAEELEMEVWSKPITMQKLMECICCLLRGEPSSCDERPLTARLKSPITMPDVIRKITNSILFL